MPLLSVMKVAPLSSVLLLILNTVKAQLFCILYKVLFSRCIKCFTVHIQPLSNRIQAKHITHLKLECKYLFKRTSVMQLAAVRPT